MTLRKDVLMQKIIDQTGSVLALMGSIKKWENILDGGSDWGGTNCDLCIRFMRGTPMCDGCPVRAQTGVPACRETPYVQWTKLHANEDGLFSFPLKIDNEEQRQVAKAELDFLKSLLPKEAKQS